MTRTLARLARDEDGATLATTAMLLMVLVGFLGVGLDIGIAYTARRSAQNAADSAAYSAAVAAADGASDLVAQAQGVAARYGLSNGAGGVTVQVNNPPTSGGHAGDPQAVEVIVTRPAEGFFSTLFVPNPQPIRARAVAISGVRAGFGCLVALNPKAAQAVLFNGVPNVNLVDCTLYDNSADKSDAMLVNGGVTVNARGIDVVGGILKNGVVTLNADVRTGVDPVSDPYAKVKPPAFSGCDRTNEIINAGNRSYAASGSRPFVFCNGLIVNAGGASFGPGVYIINGGSFTLNGSTSATANGATFVLVNGAMLNFNSAANITFKAPTSGPTAGLVIEMDKSASRTAVTLNGGSNQAFTGALYAPNQAIILNGGTTVANGGCTQVIGDTIIINGDVRLETKCAGTGVKPVGSVPPALVE